MESRFSGSDQNAKTRSAEGRKVRRRVPVRLCEHRNAEAVGLQNAAYHRRAEARMIDIRIARYEQKIVPPPVALVHFILRNRQKILIFNHISSPQYQPDVPLCLTKIAARGLFDQR